MALKWQSSAFEWSFEIILLLSRQICRLGIYFKAYLFTALLIAFTTH